MKALKISLILILPELKVTDQSLIATSIEPGQTAPPYSLTRLYTTGWLTSSSHLDIPNMIMDSYKNGWWIIPFKKFSRQRVKCFAIRKGKSVYILLAQSEWWQKEQASYIINTFRELYLECSRPNKQCNCNWL